MKILLFTLVFPLLVSSQVKVSSGSVTRIENFPSQFVDARNVDVWLPEGYTTSKKYAVLYMHDGQMLFDSETTWNKQSWQADETAAQLQVGKKTKAFIIVGIWNNGQKRHPEYFPQKAFDLLTNAEKQFVSKALQDKGRITDAFQPISDLYLKFIVSELKPYIDSHFSTLTNRQNTFIAGSSMGGLISMYALCEYPEVFGGAACLSTHWPGIFSMENNPVPGTFLRYLEQNLKRIKHRKLYFDYGDQTLDALYPPLQKRVDELLLSKGFIAKRWCTRFFPGKDHSENAWAERLSIPLQFLLGNENCAKD